METSYVEDLNGSMLLSEKLDKVLSFELDFPLEISFRFHNRGTFRQETQKSSSKLSVQVCNQAFSPKQTGNICSQPILCGDLETAD